MTASKQNERMAEALEILGAVLGNWDDATVASYPALPSFDELLSLMREIRFAEPATPRVVSERGGSPAAEDDWKCSCGNTTAAEGFHPCNALGVVMEPAAGWPHLYVCDRCGAIFNSEGAFAGRRLDVPSITFPSVCERPYLSGDACPDLIKQSTYWCAPCQQLAARRLEAR